jgi:hypothetical protein
MIFDSFAQAALWKAVGDDLDVEFSAWEENNKLAEVRVYASADDNVLRIERKLYPEMKFPYWAQIAAFHAPNWDSTKREGLDWLERELNGKEGDEAKDATYWSITHVRDKDDPRP